MDRTGGTSFSKVFKKFTLWQWSHRFHQLALKVFGEIPRLHLLKEQSALSLKSKIPSEEYNQYFKFAMIRNPWEWLVSDYSYRQQHPLATYHNFIKGMSFKDYFMWRLLEKYEDIDDLGMKRGLSARFTDQNGDILVDHVGRFENFEEEFYLFCDKIGVKEGLPHLNSSKFDNYKSYYTSEMNALVYEYFSLDIKLFGYSK